MKQSISRPSVASASVCNMAKCSYGNVASSTLSCSVAFYSEWRIHVLCWSCAVGIIQLRRHLCLCNVVPRWLIHFTARINCCGILNKVRWYAGHLVCIYSRKSFAVLTFGLWINISQKNLVCMVFFVTRRRIPRYLWVSVWRACKAIMLYRLQYKCRL